MQTLIGSGKVKIDYMDKGRGVFTVYILDYYWVWGICFAVKVERICQKDHIALSHLILCRNFVNNKGISGDDT